MRCPDCHSDFPVKPEVVVQKEPCKCGLTAEVRTNRYILIAVVVIVVTIGIVSISEFYFKSRTPADPVNSRPAKTEK